MDFNRWPQADAIIDQALALPPEERVGFVRQAAGDDHELAQHLERVVRESIDQGAFLRPGAPLSGSMGEDLERELDLASPPSPALAAGQCIEHYEAIALIGRGGMGEVYRARDLKLDRDVALKVLTGSPARNPERVTRFRREARLLALLSHPGIAAIYGVAEAGGVEALVLD
jgi:serine/threonine-protein kinase